MKVYRVELSIIDFDGLGAEQIKDVIENTRYPNYCIHPETLRIVGADIGEWSDDHPLNKHETAKQAFSEAIQRGTVEYEL